MRDRRLERLASRIVRPDPGPEVDEELAFHLDQRTAEYVARGMDPRAARAAALRRLGDLDAVRGECTRIRASERKAEARRERLAVSWLDFKLGFRMLVRYPGLTLVGGLAMAFAIWVGAGTFELVTQVLHPTLPLADGGRIVGLRNWDAAARRPEAQVLRDFAVWRQELRTVEQLGAFRTVERNLITGDGQGEPVEVAEISASGFRVARVPPLLGRALVDADERAGAPSVAVIGHAVWTRRFGGDPGVVGRAVRLGSARATIVGVMPEGFAFPVSHGVWVPLRARPLEHGWREGPGIQLFGRLAPGAGLKEAQAELSALGARTAAETPATHRHLRPQVMPFARSIVDVSGLMSAGILSSNLLLVMFLVLVCGNVALLMFARAATRESEIVVRSALGASRGRIVTQLFAEALVLGAVAAAVGLAAAGAGLRWVMGSVGAELLDGARFPFWFHASLSPTTVAYALLLAVLGAAIAGVLPALKVTRGVEARLRQASAGGGGLRFGGVWTAVIVAQIAVTVAFPAFALMTRRDAEQIRGIRVGFPEREYLSVRVEMDRDPPAGAPADTSRAAFDARFRARWAELERRLKADPAVAGVAFAERLPRQYHPYRLVEVDGGGAAPLDPRWPAYRVSSAAVEPGYFDVLRTPVVSGRGFHAGDLEEGARAVVVNRSFVDLVLGGRNPIGRRVRYVHYEEWDEGTGPGPWHEIVGVVPDLGMSDTRDPKRAGIYHAVAPGGVYPANVAVRVRGDASAFAPRLRAVAAAADPTLRLYDVMPIADISEAELRFISFWFRLLIGVSLVALLLSLAGIYSVMSFTVSRRTREIGIRVALGARPWRVLAAVFRRPLIQVGLGVFSGAALLALLAMVGEGQVIPLKWAAILAAYSAVMWAVCMLACIVPTRRALRVEPTEALRADS